MRHSWDLQFIELFVSSSNLNRPNTNIVLSYMFSIKACPESSKYQSLTHVVQSDLSSPEQLVL